MADNINNEVHLRKPEWLKLKARTGENLKFIENLLDDLHLNTVCDAASCPNRMECYENRTATFMILGRVCTRNCTFCDVTKGKAETVDSQEPEMLAEAVSRLDLKYAVVTSVTRDDLTDGGAGHFASVIKAVKARRPETLIEVLIPDFQGNREALRTVLEAVPDVLNHNVETVPRLYSEVRPMADYKQSLELLGRVKQISPDMYTKSGIMLGLGEKEDEVLKIFDDLREKQCDFLTIGQYLAPSAAHHKVMEYVHPDKFAWYKEEALKRGFKDAASGPFVRSSYQAAKMIMKLT